MIYCERVVRPSIQNSFELLDRAVILHVVEMVERGINQRIFIWRSDVKRNHSRGSKRVPRPMWLSDQYGTQTKQKHTGQRAVVNSHPPPHATQSTCLPTHRHHQALSFSLTHRNHSKA